MLIDYFYEKSDPLHSFVSKQINQSKIAQPVFPFELTDKLAEKYGITTTHTVIFFDYKMEELHRIERPFSTDQLNEAFLKAKELEREAFKI